MENIFMRYCRESRRIPINELAEKLAVSPTTYHSMESGETMLEYDHAVVLGKLFKINPALIFNAALQVEMLRCNKELIEMQKWKINHLKGLLKQQKPVQRSKKK